jgi:hypothetical protein
VTKNPVVRERRQYPRLDRSFKGRWTGTGACRISDLSLSGCFVNSLVAPLQGDETSVEVAIGDHTFTMKGRVVYVDPGMGFALQFSEVAKRERDDLERLLRALASEEMPVQD